MIEITRNKKIVDELNLIQMQVQRMANNSFLIKGWYVTVMLAIITVEITKQRFEYFYLGIFVLFVALYDSYFLMLERKYRDKYNWVVNKNNTTMDNEELFNLNPYSTKHFITENECKWIKNIKAKLVSNLNNNIKFKEFGRFLVDFLLAFFSKTIMFFYWLPVIYLIYLA